MTVWSLKYTPCRKLKDDDATSASQCFTCFRSPSLMVPCLKQRGDADVLWLFWVSRSKLSFIFLRFWKILGIGKLSTKWHFFPESRSKGYQTIGYHRISTTKGVNRTIIAQVTGAGKDDNQALGLDLSRAMKCCRTCTKEKGNKVCWANCVTSSKIFVAASQRAWNKAAFARSSLLNDHAIISMQHLRNLDTGCIMFCPKRSFQPKELNDLKV